MKHDLAYFRGRLRIDRHRLDEELEVQADHLDRIGTAVAQATRAEAFAKRAMEQLAAELARDAMRDDPKLSHAKASADVTLNREWRSLWEAHQEAKQELLHWESLQKAWYQRGFDLKALGDLYGHQYFHTTATSIQGPALSKAREGVDTYMSRRAERRLVESEEPARRRSRLNE